MQVSFTLVDKLSRAIMSALVGSECSIGQGAMACAMSIGRLLNPGKTLSDEVEIKFVEDMMEWVGMYFVEGREN